jgi:signal transduction histidine kinase
MDFYSIISLINGIVAILFGLFIYTRNSKNITNITFFLMSASVAVWSFSYYVWLSVTTVSEALFWSRMLNLGATFIPIFYLHWILSILNKIKEKKHILLFGYVLTFVCAIYSFSPIYIKSVMPVLSFSFWPQAGLLYIIFLIFGYFGLTAYGLYNLFKERNNTNIEKKHQINYVILGSVFGFGGGATNFPLMFGLEIIPPFGQSLVILYIIIFGLATLKYHLFDIRLILTEMLVGVIGIFLLILPFFMPTSALRILTASIMLLFVVFGYYLIRATREEVARKEELERINKLKSEFISITSHQLRTPLAAIRGYASMLRSGDYGKMPEESLVPIDYMYESSVRLIKLVNSMLSVSRLDRGKVELKIQDDVSIESLLEDCIKDIELQSKEKGIYISYLKPKKSLPLVKGDPEKLKEAIGNIINNAILYTIKGGITITAIKKDFDNILIKVKDTGIGIEQEDLGKIFKSFSRGKGGIELYTQGTGLGLYVAKNFIEMHNGKLTVSSKGKDKGSIFCIEIPIKANLENKHNFSFNNN